MEEEALDYFERNELLAAREVNSALKARNEAQARLDKANQAYEAWRVLIRQERERRGIPDAVPGAVESIQEFVESEHRNRTEYVRSILKIAGANGTTSAEILRISRADNPSIIVANYPYGQLSKLKAAGEIVPVAMGGDSRYVLKQFADQLPIQEK